MKMEYNEQNKTLMILDWLAREKLKENCSVVRMYLELRKIEMLKKLKALELDKKT